MKHIAINELPPNERPYEKLFNKGVRNLEDFELLAIFIRSGNSNSSALEIARKILSHPSIDNNLMNLHKLRIGDLCSIDGIGKIRSAQFVSLIELARRISKASAKSLLSFKDPSTIADYYMEDLRHLSYEKVIVAFLNARGDFIGDKEMFKGTATASLASPREVFIEALKNDAVNIVLIHNHPSGDSSPSKEDYQLTEKLLIAGKMIQIPLIDHIIIGNKNYFSFCENKSLYF